MFFLNMSVPNVISYKYFVYIIKMNKHKKRK